MTESILFQLRADKSGIFDGASKTGTLISSSKVKHKKEGVVNFSKGANITIPSNKSLDSLSSFTIETTVNLVHRKNRQNIIESQSPPIALFIEKGGKLMGSIHTTSGWKSVTSGNHKVPLKKDIALLFSRDESGNMRLEINGKEVGKRKIRGPLKSVGNHRFIIGVGMDKRAFQLEGTLSELTIRNGAYSSNSRMLQRRESMRLQQKFRRLLNLDRLRVSTSRDESYYRLRPIKSIMASVGVTTLTDLGALNIPNNTVITPGKILIAPRKGRNKLTVDWKAVANLVKTSNAKRKKEVLAKHLPNRNSSGVLKPAVKKVQNTSGNRSSNMNSAMHRLTNSTSISRRIAGNELRLSALKTNLNTENIHVDAITTPALARMPLSIDLASVINLDSDKIAIKDSKILEHLSSPQPSLWPSTSVPQHMMMITNTLPVDASVIIANTLDMRNTRLRVQPEVKKLYIIAEEIIVNGSSEITWSRPGGSTPSRADNPDLNGRGYSGKHLKPNSKHGLDGEDGRAGISGTRGANGRTAPALEIWARDMNGIPDLELSGEKGIRGGRGQRGGRGGNGADGDVGKWAWFFGKHCVSDPGDGGDGGHGGDGGNGGPGGNGGGGGDIIIGTLEGRLESTVTANAFRINNDGGIGGDGGAGGSGGNGGRGGRAGIGQVCKDARNGRNGAQGQRGRMGSQGHKSNADGTLEFFEFTESAWEELLNRPWLTELSPEYVFPGDQLILTGSAFTAHDLVHIGTASLVPVVNADESLSVTVPVGIGGGEHAVYVRRSDGTESNRLRLWVKPQLSLITDVLNPGSLITVSGKAFLNGAVATVNGESTPTTFHSATSLSFEMPGTGGTGSSEQSVAIRILNPDGMLSNIRSATIPRILEIPFKFPQHALNFDNFKIGSPSWGTFEDTFGSAEVWHQVLDPVFGHPVLTSAFYAFYHYFLLGEDNGGLATGFCTSMSAKVLDELWTGSTDTFTRINLNNSIRKDLTAIHGRLLSRESLIDFHDQGRNEVANVLSTYRIIEHVFLNGCDRHNAPMLFFIPSGAVWDAGYIDSLSDSHCIVPVRFVYPEGHPGPDPNGLTDPDGVTMFCWDCNHSPSDDDPSSAPRSENCRVVFKRVDGVIHYDYFDGGTDVKFSSEDGVTLGHMSNGKYLLSDHDLPFTGPFGLTRFVIDFLLSPADLQITDDDGNRTGTFGNEILSEINDSHPCYLMKNAFLLPVSSALNRKIIGNGTGQYAYHSISPNGTSVSLENVPTIPGEVDIFSMNADGSQIRISPGSDKSFSFQLAREVGDEIRTLSINGVGGAPGAEMDITLSPELSVVRIGNRASARPVDISIVSVNKNTKAHLKMDRGGIALNKDHDLILSVEDWDQLDLDVQTLKF